MIQIFIEGRQELMAEDQRCLSRCKLHVCAIDELQGADVWGIKEQDRRFKYVQVQAWADLVISLYIDRS